MTNHPERADQGIQHLHFIIDPTKKTSGVNDPAESANLREDVGAGVMPEDLVTECRAIVQALLSKPDAPLRG